VKNSQNSTTSNDVHSVVKEWLGEYGHVLSPEQLASIREVCDDINDSVAVLDETGRMGALMFLFTMTYTHPFVQEQFMSRQITALANYREISEERAKGAMLN